MMTSHLSHLHIAILRKHSLHIFSTNIEHAANTLYYVFFSATASLPYLPLILSEFTINNTLLKQSRGKYR
jgi:hypothetical protein